MACLQFCTLITFVLKISGLTLQPNFKTETNIYMTQINLEAFKDRNFNIINIDSVQTY